MQQIFFLSPEWHDKLPSTSDMILERIKFGENLPSGFVLAALEQTAGHGRFDRHWFSNPGKDLTFSFLMETRADIKQLASLSMAVALGVATALDTFGVHSYTKWPNDLLVKGKKICGIMAKECHGPPLHGEAAVVGVGLNVNMNPEDAKNIDRPVTSTFIETGENYLLKTVLDRILQMLPDWISLWEDEGFSGIRDDWTLRSSCIGKTVTVEQGKHRKTGILMGFGEWGQMLVRSEDGSTHNIWGGELEPN
jgi:BirA family biotin operon repressor/biotin-[acetyl-CoA-carboxylase] ligase